MYRNKHYFNMAPGAFSSLIEDAFHNGWNKINEEIHTGSVPVNIQETDKNYDLHVIAPGLSKEDFKISVDRNLLHISYEHKDEKKEQDGKMLRTEYHTRSFKRTFTLTEKIDTAHISAKYTDGILYVTLPKKENVEQSNQEIIVA